MWISLAHILSVSEARSREQQGSENSGVHVQTIDISLLPEQRPYLQSPVDKGNVGGFPLPEDEAGGRPAQASPHTQQSPLIYK